MENLDKEFDLLQDYMINILIRIRQKHGVPLRKVTRYLITLQTDVL